MRLPGTILFIALIGVVRNYGMLPLIMCFGLAFWCYVNGWIDREREILKT